MRSSRSGNSRALHIPHLLDNRGEGSGTNVAARRKGAVALDPAARRRRPEEPTFAKAVLLPLETLVFLSIGAFMGGFVNGFAGFGIALFALGWWLQIMEPIEAVALTLVAGVVTGAPGLLVVWRHIEPRLLATFALPALVGIPLGTATLVLIEAPVLVAFVAVLLIGYGLFFSLRSRLPALPGERPLADSVVGFASGVLGGMAGLSGVFPTIWLSLRAWPKGRTRGLLQPFNTIILLLAMGSVWLEGGYTALTWHHLAYALPGMAAGVVAGILLYRRANDAVFRRSLVWLMLLSGFALLAQSIWTPV